MDTRSKKKREAALAKFRKIVEQIQQESVRKGTDKMTMAEIDAEIALARKEAREKGV